jgi:hypothetical protein
MTKHNKLDRSTTFTDFKTQCHTCGRQFMGRTNKQVELLIRLHMKKDHQQTANVMVMRETDTGYATAHGTNETRANGDKGGLQGQR